MYCKRIKELLKVFGVETEVTITKVMIYKIGLGKVTSNCYLHGIALLFFFYFQVCCKDLWFLETGISFLF